MKKEPNKQRTYNHPATHISGWLCMLSVLFVAGCTVGPDYERPRIEMPDAWTQSIVKDGNELQNQDENLKWWAKLSDPVLDSLIEHSIECNRDIRQAYYKIQESRANRAYVTGSRWPQLDGAASYTRSRSSENGIVAASGEEIGQYSAGFDAAWEIDLFGGIKRSIESAQAQLEASVDSYYGVQIALEGEVASTYVELRTIQLRIQYAQENIRIQKNTLELTRNLFDTGQVSELDVKRAESTLANTESQIPSLKSSEAQAVNRLAVLLGGFPGSLSKKLTTNTGIIPKFALLPAVGLPADLLRRRPDIRQAERQLASKIAQIGVATADKYPSFTLFGTFDLQARTLSNLGDFSSLAYSYGPNLKWNVFNGNRTTNAIKMKETLAEQARIQYEQTVLTAVEEVENALTSYAREQERYAALERAAAASEQSMSIVQTQYKNGLINFQDVLDVQRTVSEQQDSLASSQGKMIQNVIRLYKTLGGGWTIYQELPTDKIK
jgi:NodT family efflux transporter outer membrane factor (OMF) lipoprotein